MRRNKAILAFATAALLVGCGGGGGGDTGHENDPPQQDPGISTEPQFDDGLFEVGADVSTAAAFEGSADALFADTGELASFLGAVDEAIFSNQISILGLGQRTEELLSTAFFTTGDGDRRATRQARRGQSVGTSSVSPLAEGPESGSYVVECPEGGQFTEEFVLEQDGDETFYVETGGFTWTFTNCAIKIDADDFVLNGSWEETYKYEDRGTPESGAGTGRWNDTFDTEIALRASLNGSPNVMVLDGSLSGEEVADYEGSETEYSEDGTFTLNVARIEARLAKQPGTPVYIGQVKASLIEEFTYREASGAWEETGRTEVSGRVASRGMQGALSIRTDKVVSYTDSSDSLGESCPDQGIVVASGRDGNQIDVRFGEDTGITGVVVQVVTTGGDYINYLNCADADYLGPVLFGPFSGALLDGSGGQ
jgi:hypothetical protein